MDTNTQVKLAMTERVSRVRGAMYGVAVCDALGGPVEFKFRGSFAPVEGMRYNGNFDLPPGCWTDDTSMTLCLAQSLVEQNGRFVPRDQIKKYIRWMEKGYMSSIGRCFDIGNATRLSLSIWRDNFKKGHSDSENQEGVVPIGMTSINAALNKESSCGNGSLMRCVSIPLVYHSDPASMQKWTELASIPTHPHPICVEACQLYNTMVASILDTSSTLQKDTVFRSFRQHPYHTAAMIDTFSKYKSLDDWQRTPESSIRSSGFVIETLEAALWAFFSTQSFREGALKVVNLGDDADTVGAVYGGLAGAYYGYEAIPVEWVDALQARSTLDPVVQGLVQVILSKAL